MVERVGEFAAADKFPLENVIMPPKSAIAVVGILTFLWNWDEFLWPLIDINKTEMMTLPILLGRFSMAEGGVIAGP
jgi:multiple sugar transport system permease protein